MKYFYIERIDAPEDKTVSNFYPFEVIHITDEAIDDYELMGIVETYEDLLNLFASMWVSKDPYFEEEFIYELFMSYYEDSGMILPKDYKDIPDAKWWKTRWEKHPIYCRKYKKLCDRWNDELGPEEYPYIPICYKCEKYIKDFIRELNGHLDWDAVVEPNEESEDK